MHTSVKWQNPRLITICPVQLCELVPEKLCDKLLRECSGGCKVRCVTVAERSKAAASGAVPAKPTVMGGQHIHENVHSGRS